MSNIQNNIRFYSVLLFFSCRTTSVCEKNFRSFPSKIGIKILTKARKIAYLKMQHIQWTQRYQLQISSLEDKIGTENPVRFIDAFVEHICLESVGFTVQTLKSEGRPSFDTKVFLKIYLYGYLNGLRSSRKLEKECIRNIQWLLEDIRPNY